MVVALTLLLIAATGAFVVTLGLYTKTKVQLARVETERDHLKDAHETARGYLYGLTTSQLPVVSDGAIRVLADIDKTTGKVKG